VGIDLEFIKPFHDLSLTTFTITPDAAGSHVTWAMDGHTNFISKAMCLVTPMDKMLGPDFEKGLSQMKSTSEAAVASATTAAPDSGAAVR
jgi:hypothetical protein